MKLWGFTDLNEKLRTYVKNARKLQRNKCWYNGFITFLKDTKLSLNFSDTDFLSLIQ